MQTRVMSRHKFRNMISVKKVGAQTQRERVDESQRIKLAEALSQAKMIVKRSSVSNKSGMDHVPGG